jgi:hypothetical protein
MRKEAIRLKEEKFNLRRKAYLMQGRIDLVENLEDTRARARIYEGDPNVDPDEEISDDENEETGDNDLLVLEKEEVQIHTKLTNYVSLKVYRERMMSLVTIYVKVMPGGYIRKFIVDGSWTVNTFYNMFNSHSHCNNGKSQMMVVPTETGLFTMDNQHTSDNEFMLGECSGLVTLDRYGMKQKSSSICCLFFNRFMKEYAPSTLNSFFDKNCGTDWRPDKLPVWDALDKMRYVNNLAKDRVQLLIKSIVTRQFNDQVEEELVRYKQMGIDYRNSTKSRAEAALKIKLAKRLEEKKEKEALQRRIESQLNAADVMGEEREKMRALLIEREMNKKGNVSEADKALAIDKLNEYNKRMERMKQRREGIASGSISQEDRSVKEPTADGLELESLQTHSTDIDQIGNVGDEDSSFYSDSEYSDSSDYTSDSSDYSTESGSDSDGSGTSYQSGKSTSSYGSRNNRGSGYSSNGSEADMSEGGSDVDDDISLQSFNSKNSFGSKSSRSSSKRKVSISDDNSGDFDNDINNIDTDGSESIGLQSPSKIDIPLLDIEGTTPKKLRKKDKKYASTPRSFVGSDTGRSDGSFTMGMSDSERSDYSEKSGIFIYISIFIF